MSTYNSITKKMSESQYERYARKYDENEMSSRYNWKYRENIRESDKRLIELITMHAKGRTRPRLLDLGCGNGNLLYNLKGRLAEVDLVGVDLAAALIDACRKDVKLAGIQFETGDLTALAGQGIGQFDIIVVNAVLQILNDEELDRAFKAISMSLRPNGVLLNFDGYHPFDQNLEVTVSRPTAPEVHRKLTYHYRGYRFTEELLKKHALIAVEFERFEIPIDLELSPTAPETTSYTIRTAKDGRLIMIGPIAQPWCFLSAKRDG